MKLIPLSATLAVLALPATANEFAPAMSHYLETEVRQWVSDPVLIQAIQAQNARHAGLDQADIDALDQSWRAEIGQIDGPTITPVLNNPASDYLRQQVEDSAGAITELFIMDSHGLNVAASDVTSDMWQGDEAKFIETFPVGPNAVHLSDIEFDESSQTYQGQISIPIVDPDSGQVIGAMTIGVNAEALM